MPHYPGWFIVILGVIILAAGVLAIVYRDQILASSLRNQQRLFGEGFTRGRQGSPAAIVGGAVIILVAGVIVMTVGIVRTATGSRQGV
jgi:hypothetical protein